MWIVFESHPEGVSTQGSLWKVRTDGTMLTQLTDGSGDDREPNWSPAGNSIVFQSMRSGNWDIWTVDTQGGNAFNVTQSSSQGGNAFNVTQSSYEDTDASWSPDGTRIVYSTDTGSLLYSALFVINANGGTPVRVRPTSNVYEGAPSWSPDGRWIAFETSPGNPDGSPGTTIAIAAAPP
jgi:TolB protein